MVLFYSGQTDYELAEYRRAVELASDRRRLRALLVHGLAEAGYWTEAAAECRRWLEAQVLRLEADTLLR